MDFWLVVSDCFLSKIPSDLRIFVYFFGLKLATRGAMDLISFHLISKWTSIYGGFLKWYPNSWMVFMENPKTN